MKSNTSRVCCGYIGVVVLALSQACAEDWPQWFGPRRDGVWHESGIVDSIPVGGLPVRWRARVLNGWSGPAVASGRVFVTDHNYKSDPEVERVLCFDQRTGKQLWFHEYPCHYGNMEYGNGPRATPTVHDGLVYALGTMGHLACLNVETGKVVWQKDPRELNIEMPRYGVSASPVVDGELVIITAGARPGGTVMAFDRKTGVERWRALSDRPAYSTPIVFEAAGERQLIVWTGDNVNGLNVRTGKLLWQVPYKATFDPAQATATPVMHKDKLLCLASWNRGSLMLELDQTKPGVKVVWKTRSKPTASSSTPIFRHDKYIYAIVGDGSLCCLDAANGQEVWASREPTSETMGMAHLIPNGDRTFILNQHGHLIAASLTPEGYKEHGRMLLIEPTAGYRAGGPVCWAHPAFGEKCVFARNDRELVCVSLAADEVQAHQDKVKQDVAASPIRSTLLPGITAADSQQTLAVAVSPDGKTVAIGSGWGVVRQIDLATGAAVPSAKRHNDWVCAVAYSWDGKYLASVGGSEFTPERNGKKTSAEIKIWDRKAGSERGKLAGHTSKVFAAAFSPDGRTLATGAADRTIRLWDVETMTERHVLRGHTDAISSLAWSRDGRVLASASWDKTLRLWNIDSGEQASKLMGAEDELMSVAISPDGKWLAAGGADWKVRLWEISSEGKVSSQPFVLSAHRGTVYAIAFSPLGKSLATASGDETIRLWNLKTRESTDVLRGHRSGVSAICYAPDGSQLFSGAMNGLPRVWQLIPPVKR